MKIKALARILTLVALCGLSVPIMGAGNDCPKQCIAVDTACTNTCGGNLVGNCVETPSGGYTCDMPDPDDDGGEKD